MITFQKELFKDIMHELPPLFAMHYDEVALDKHAIQLNPAWSQYLAMDSNGVLNIVTVRNGLELIGYYFAIVWPHLHYAQSLTAHSDMFWVKPDYRKELNGFIYVELFRHVEKMLKGMGVQKHYVMTKVHKDASILMKRLGYKFIEKIFTRLL